MLRSKKREKERERERALASDGIHTTIDGITLTVGCQKIMAANTQRAAYTFYIALQLHRQKHTFLSLSQKRQRWCASFSFRVTCTREPIAIFGDGRISLRRYIIPCTCNSYPRSRHVEADAQVTLKALCILHNAPA